MALEILGVLTVTVLPAGRVFQQQKGTTELEKIQRAAMGVSHGPAGVLRRRLLGLNPYLGAAVMDEDF